MPFLVGSCQQINLPRLGERTKRSIIFRSRSVEFQPFPLGEPGRDHRSVPKHERPISSKTNALRADARSALVCGRSLLESAGCPQKVRRLLGRSAGSLKVCSCPVRAHPRQQGDLAGDLVGRYQSVRFGCFTQSYPVQPRNSPAEWSRLSNTSICQGFSFTCWTQISRRINCEDVPHFHRCGSTSPRGTI